MRRSPPLLILFVLLAALLLGLVAASSWAADQREVQLPLASRLAGLEGAEEAPVVKFVPEGSIDPPSGAMLYPGSISVRDAITTSKETKKFLIPFPPFPLGL